jgi:hypothetical protein
MQTAEVVLNVLRERGRKGRVRLFDKYEYLLISG